MSFSFDLKRKTVEEHNKEIDLFKKGVYPPEFNDLFKAAVRKRDNYKCALCSKSERQVGHKLDVHHINYTKYTVRVNCVTLCRDCHNFVHSDKSHTFRNKWSGKLYKIVLRREGLKTGEAITEAWRKPDEYSP